MSVLSCGSEACHCQWGNWLSPEGRRKLLLLAASSRQISPEICSLSKRRCVPGCRASATCSAEPYWLWVLGLRADLGWCEFSLRGLEAGQIESLPVSVPCSEAVCCTVFMKLCTLGFAPWPCVGGQHAVQLQISQGLTACFPGWWCEMELITSPPYKSPMLRDTLVTEQQWSIYIVKSKILVWLFSCKEWACCSPFVMLWGSPISLRKYEGFDFGVSECGGEVVRAVSPAKSSVPRKWWLHMTLCCQRLRFKSLTLGSCCKVSERNFFSLVSELRKLL